MRWYWIALPAAVAGLFNGAGTADAAKPGPLAGWYGVFPAFAGYDRTFTTPVVAAGEKPESYRQTAKYGWTGGAYRAFEITLARDPAFKKAHAADVLRKEAQEIKLGKHTGWVWDLRGQAVGKPDAVTARLVVPLAEDKAVIVEAKGQIFRPEGLGDLAASVDLGRAEVALAAPPRTDFRPSLGTFRALTKAASLSEVMAWVGNHDETLGPGQEALVYKLADGSRVVLKFDAGFISLKAVRHEAVGGRAEELLK